MTLRELDNLIRLSPFRVRYPAAKAVYLISLVD